MEKLKKFHHAIYDLDTIKLAMEEYNKISSQEITKKWNYKLSLDDEEWQYNNFVEFCSDFRKGFISAHLNSFESEYNIYISIYNSKYGKHTSVSVKAKEKFEIEELFEIFESNYQNFKIETELDEKSQPIIFIGHGRNEIWRNLKDHLQDLHHFQITAYEIGSRAGHTIRDILDEMLENSSFALLVLTGEDLTSAGELNPRLNVVHEVGLFQGKLGFSRAIILLEEGTSEFSNINGIQQIRFSKGNIRETFGDVLATIKREFN